MTKKQILKLGFKLNSYFDIDGKTFSIDTTYGRYYSAYCHTDKKSLVTRGTLDTCINKVLNYKEV